MVFNNTVESWMKQEPPFGMDQTYRDLEVFLGRWHHHFDGQMARLVSPSVWAGDAVSSMFCFLGQPGVHLQLPSLFTQKLLPMRCLTVALMQH